MVKCFEIRDFRGELKLGISGGIEIRDFKCFEIRKIMQLYHEFLGLDE
jgi:hypothetical protein